MKNLLEKLEKNPEMKTKIDELNQNPKSVPEDFIKVAAEYGVELTAEDFRPANAQGEVSDSELDAVAGGGVCACAFGGGGTASKYDETCVCVLGGGGEYTEKAKESGIRCFCALGGAGEEGTTTCRFTGND